MDKYVCLKKSDVVIPTEGEEESSGDESDGDDGDEEDEEDESEDREGSDAGGPSTVKHGPVEAEDEFEVKEADVSDPFNLEAEADSWNRICMPRSPSSWASRKTPPDPQKMRLALRFLERRWRCSTPDLVSRTASIPPFV